MATCLVPLVFASYSDWKTRTVRNEVWLVMLLAGLAIAVARWIYTAELLLTIYSFTVTFLISLVLYACKAFGGADTKAVTCVSLLIPVNISTALTPFFTITVFLNTFILMGVLYLTIFGYNSLQRLKGENLFYGLKSESKGKKLVVLFTCLRLDWESLQNKKHLYPIQYMDKKNGKKEMHLANLRNIPSKDSKDIKSLEGKKDEIPPNKIWIYFSKPLIPVITLSVALSFFLGDLLQFIINIL